MMDDIPVTDLMRRDITYLGPENNAFEAAKILSSSCENAILVKDGINAIGLVTAQEIVKGVISEAKDPSNASLKDIMSHPLVTLDHHSSILDACRVMRDKKAGTIIITESGNVRGFITTGDLVYILPLIGIN